MQQQHAQRHFLSAIVACSLALGLAACEQEPGDPFGLNGTADADSAASENREAASETERECKAKFFYNAPNGKLVMLGCDG